MIIFIKKNKIFEILSVVKMGRMIRFYICLVGDFSCLIVWEYLVCLDGFNVILCMSVYIVRLFVLSFFFCSYY